MSRVHIIGSFFIAVRAKDFFAKYEGKKSPSNPPHLYPEPSEKAQRSISRATSEGDHERALLPFLKKQHTADKTLMCDAD